MGQADEPRGRRAQNTKQELLHQAVAPASSKSRPRQESDRQPHPFVLVYFFLLIFFFVLSFVPRLYLPTTVAAAPLVCLCSLVHCHTPSPPRHALPSFPFPDSGDCTLIAPHTFECRQAAVYVFPFFSLLFCIWLFSLVAVIIWFCFYAPVAL